MYEQQIEAYLPTAELLSMTTKIESLLEHLGGEGSGVFDKAKSLEKKLPFGFVDRVISLAEIRNQAVHGDPNIKNFDVAMTEASNMMNLLERKARMEVIQESMKNVLETYLKYDKIETLPKSCQSWIKDINEFVKTRSYNEKKAVHIIKNEKEMFHLIHVFTAYHAQRSFMKITAIYFTVVTIAVFIFIITK